MTKNCIVTSKFSLLSTAASHKAMSYDNIAR